MLKGLMRLGFRLFFNKRVTPGVPAIIRNSKGQILLGKRKNNMLMYPGYWGLPGGLIEYGETVEQAIRRELREEMKISANVVGYGKPVMDMPNQGYKAQDLNVPVYCKIISGVPRAGDETSEIGWFSPAEIREMELAYSHKKILKNEGLI